jgi:hypothetical protein
MLAASSHNAHSKQPRNQRQSWLEYFKFDDSGVELIPEFVVPEAENAREIPYPRLSPLSCRQSASPNARGFSIDAPGTRAEADQLQHCRPAADNAAFLLLIGAPRDRRWNALRES